MIFKQEKKTYIQILFTIILLLFAFYKVRIGIHSDEVHSLAVGDMISRGSLMFKDCWFYLQLSAVLNAPLSSAYYRIVGSNDGIILFFRIISLLIQTVISIFFYQTFRNKQNQFFVFIVAICLFSFVPDFLNFGYKPELIWFTILEICFAYRFCQSNKNIYVILLGISLSVCVLCFPTSVLQLFVWFIFLFFRNKKKKISTKAVWLLPLCCLCCACIFFIYVFSNISLKEFIHFFPEILNDDQLAGNFITKLYKPFIKLVELGLLSIIPIAICTKVKFVKKFVINLKIPVFTFLLVLAFLGQCFIERAGITWHCITYPYSLTMFFLPLLYFCSSPKEKDENHDMFWCFNLMTYISYWCISLASNQNNITCIYAGIFSTCGFLILIGNKAKDEFFINFPNEKRILAISICTLSLLMYIFPVWDQEAVYFEKYGMRHIFSDRTLMTSGPAKGIYVGPEMYDRVNRLCDITNRYTTEKDKVYIVENSNYCAFGYMNQKGSYATYSPRGNYYDRIKQYYDVNPQMLATVLLISKDYIQEAHDETFPSGKALEEIIENNKYTKVEDDKYIIYKLP